MGEMIWGEGNEAGERGSYLQREAEMPGFSIQLTISSQVVLLA